MATDGMGKIFANHTFCKRLLPKELPQLEKKNNPIKKGWRTYIDISPKGTYTWPISTSKMLSITNHWEMHIQVTVRYHFLPIRVAIVKRTKTKPRKRQVFARCGALGSWAALMQCKMGEPLWRTVWWLLKNSTRNYHVTQQLHFRCAPQRRESRNLNRSLYAHVQSIMHDSQTVRTARASVGAGAGGQSGA